MMGVVISGKKKARKFMAMEEYKRRFKDKLGINPYEGTLNVATPYKKILEKIDGVAIDGFKKNGKSYGKVKCFPVRIKKLKAAIIIPERSKEDYIEIISKHNLRERLNLKDGDEIKIDFVPFVKVRKKMLLDCGEEKNGKIKIYYEEPLLKNPLIEECEERRGNKVLPSRIVASLIFDGNEKQSFKKLVSWIKKRYSIMYPPVLIDYGSLKEWQIEIKWNDG
ncbi:MAG: CTP-dependent riboflavin kinase [Thermoplasmata archaeon]|nr:MAG: CTP-dependent riboflavin kinase [Thermoplasmata archaeon]